MVVKFRRAVSFPSPKAEPATTSAKRAAYGVRSASLPSRLLPLTAHLDESTAALRCWSSAQSGPATWLCSGTGHLAGTLSAISDILLHPQAHDIIRRVAGPWIECILDGLLRLADAHSTFRLALVSSVLPSISDSISALRRGDHTRLASASLSMRRASGELTRLASSLSRRQAAPLSLPADPSESAIAAAVSDGLAAVVSASAVLFIGVASVTSGSAKSSSSMRKSEKGDQGERTAWMRVWWVADLVRWKWRAKRGQRGERERRGEEMAAEVERTKGVEETVKAVESGSESVFRAAVNARVSLLNILTPSF